MVLLYHHVCKQKWRLEKTKSRLTKQKPTVMFLFQKEKQKHLYGSILVLKWIQVATLFVLIYRSVACARHTTVAVKDLNTSNLCSHLKSKHPEEYALVCQASKKKG